MLLQRAHEDAAPPPPAPVRLKARLSHSSLLHTILQHFSCYFWFPDDTSLKSFKDPRWNKCNIYIYLFPCYSEWNISPQNCICKLFLYLHIKVQLMEDLAENGAAEELQ